MSGAAITTSLLGRRVQRRHDGAMGTIVSAVVETTERYCTRVFYQAEMATGTLCTMELTERGNAPWVLVAMVADAGTVPHPAVVWRRAFEWAIRPLRDVPSSGIDVAALAVVRAAKAGDVKMLWCALEEASGQ